MVGFLVECGRRAQRPGLVNTLMRGNATKYEEDIHTLLSLVEESECGVIHHLIHLNFNFFLVIAERKANPTDKKDLLHVMLEGKDPQTGKGLSMESIRNNVSHIDIS